jgi:hypothetical protein
MSCGMLYLVLSVREAGAGFGAQSPTTSKEAKMLLIGFRNRRTLARGMLDLFTSLLQNCNRGRHIFIMVAQGGMSPRLRVVSVGKPSGASSGREANMGCRLCIACIVADYVCEGVASELEVCVVDSTE